MNCFACSSALPADSHFCPACGAAQPQATTGPTRRLDSEPAPAKAAAASIRQGVCPRCTAATIYTDANRGGLPTAFVTLMPDRQAPITHYICRSCGYMEQYILEADDRDALQDAWVPIDPHAQPSSQPTAHDIQRVRELLASGQSLDALSYLRAATGMTVREANDYLARL